MQLDKFYHGLIEHQKACVSNSRAGVFGRGMSPG